MDQNNKRKDEIITYLKDLRETIIAAFEGLEPSKRFERKCWDYQSGTGGGEMSVLRGDPLKKQPLTGQVSAELNSPCKMAPALFLQQGLA